MKVQHIENDLGSFCEQHIMGIQYKHQIQYTNGWNVKWNVMKVQHKKTLQQTTTALNTTFLDLLSTKYTLTYNGFYMH